MFDKQFIYYWDPLESSVTLNLSPIYGHARRNTVVQKRTRCLPTPVNERQWQFEGCGNPCDPIYIYLHISDPCWIDVIAIWLLFVVMGLECLGCNFLAMGQKTRSKTPQIMETTVYLQSLGKLWWDGLEYHIFLCWKATTIGSLLFFAPDSPTNVLLIPSFGGTIPPVRDKKFYMRWCQTQLMFQLSSCGSFLIIIMPLNLFHVFSIVNQFIC